ncbi:MAG: HAMP domain-containing sensor histidine kinase [Ignavibacteriaceae bacterium]|jgi:Signal transduction histidine kinase|nr:MAG: sensor histidine kinase [Chlorobiota bacterium]KXK06443.1 MAG: Signal transduction histidine kinase [Chlorobi bacterium OLB4]MBV6399045.1 Adaptive-response sensory-kinase SasA [Ignavibacteria bacterium]MCC6885263.1 HAMP domain-containing histidine kinase [Ignavibacteriales bacterium]MCE7953335.1 sensor histidine kinase [Chlorobi bacterium CHB7]MDL1887248.1 HAMP domain-containing histidine kinase [Ignavibacteria bacterium CHB1]MEB2330123.1 HAMP domain-containing sensor histidine kinase
MNKFGSFKIKIALIFGGLLIIIIILLYTQSIVTKIENREKQIAGLYARSLEYLANDENESGEYNFIFNEIIFQIDFPVIATDPNYRYITMTRNVNLDTNRQWTALDTAKLFELAQSMAEINPPIKVTYQDSIVLNLVHYGQSNLVRELKIFPIVEITIAVLFLFISYIGFSYIKRTEQSNIWVGLSRETAHQLGTPLSSLMGWVELLKENQRDNDKALEIIREVENDIEKLNKITGRFSKIGSKPELKKEDLNKLIVNVKKYFEKRIPSLKSTAGDVKKKVEMSVNSNHDVFALVNKDLFEWVVENLFKNALDAMDKKSGEINVTISENEEDAIIDITDNGKGIDNKFKKDVFRPGYSTKKRGWGLGLSLSKRIIEDYHKGKLILLDTDINKGTTFRIKLSKQNNDTSNRI